MLHRISNLCVIAVFTASTAFSQTQWEEVQYAKGSFPVERHEAAFVYVKNKFYLLGGRGIRPVSIYNPQKRIWTQGAKAPLELHHYQPIVYKDKIYIAGAMTGPYPGETPVPHIYIYDPAIDSWEQGPEIPAERRRGSTGVVVYENKLYMVCGIRDGHRGDHKNWLDVYDFKTRTWTTLADAPRPRDHFQASIADNKLYVVGGRRSNAPERVFDFPVAEVDVYDFKRNSWSTLPKPLPTLRAGTFNVVKGFELLVIGGESKDQLRAHSEVEILNILTGEWRKGPSLVQGRHGTGVFLYKGYFYTASGCGNRGGEPELQSMERIRIDAY